MNTASSSINYDWRQGTPGWDSDNFTIHWVGVIEFPRDGFYLFNGTVDDRVEIFVDNESIGKQDGCGDYLFIKSNIKKGPHSVMVRFEEDGGDATISMHIY